MRAERALVHSRLRDIKGGDDARLALLAGPLAAKLVGREGSRHAMALLSAVLRHRGVPHPDLPPEPKLGEQVCLSALEVPGALQTALDQVRHSRMQGQQARDGPAQRDAAASWRPAPESAARAQAR